MKKITKLIMLLCLLLLALSGCGKTPEGDETGEKAKEVVVCIKQDPAPLDPFSGTRDVRIYVLDEVYQRPFNFNGYGGELIPTLAKSYEISGENSINVVFNEDIYDTAGNHITAEDVKFSYETAMESHNYSRINDVESVEVVGDYEVKINFSCPATTVSSIDNALTEVYIVSEKAYTESEDKLSTKSCGTGPYYVETYTEGSEVVLLKNENYWRKDASAMSRFEEANVDKITYSVITDVTTMPIGLMNGEIDFCAFMNANDYASFEDGGEAADAFNVYNSPTPYYYTYTINADEASPFNNVNLRLAFCYAIDQDAVAKKIWGDSALPVHGAGSPDYVGYQAGWDAAGYYDGKSYYEYNPDLAKEYLNKYLEETGTTLDDLQVRIYVSQMAGMGDMAAMAQSYLSAIGIKNAEAQVYDSATLGDIKKDTSKWEISVYTGYANKYITEVWKLYFDHRDYSWNGTMTYAHDDVLQEKLEAVMQQDNFTPENLNDFNKYVYDNAYILGCSGQKQKLVYPSYVADIFCTARGIPLPGSCHYNW
ncbi:MAG: ABC transporter substrate-binding protein [Erysipelotrichaceae bacterium]|nr:ABC transporter substrate-binding protein [Erysipelotrichaceae bacterium]